jgi:hypothetical protein
MRVAESIRMVLLALGLAIVAFAATVGIALALEPRVSVPTAFSPGFIIQRALNHFGFRQTNRTAVVTTILCWWALFLALILAWRSWKLRLERRPDVKIHGE